MERVVLGLLFGSFALRDIAICEDELGDFTLLVPDGAGLDSRYRHVPSLWRMQYSTFFFTPVLPASRAGLQYLESIIGVNLVNRSLAKSASE